MLLAPFYSRKYLPQNYLKTTTVALFRLQYQFAIQCFITKVKFANVTCYFETSSYSVAAVQNTQLLTTASLFVSRHTKSQNYRKSVLVQDIYFIYGCFHRRDVTCTCKSPKKHYFWPAVLNEVAHILQAKPPKVEGLVTLRDQIAEFHCIIKCGLCPLQKRAHSKTSIVKMQISEK